MSITGYGQDGPYANKAGHDLNYIGYSGLLGTTVKDETGPVIPGGQVADVAAGSYMAVNACLAAIYARNHSGQGQHVDVSMLDCVMPITAMQVAEYYATGVEKKGDFALSGGHANYNVYECSDGKYLALGTLEPKFWEPFCNLVGKEDWKNRLLDTGDDMNDLKQEVARLINTKTQAEWIALTEPLNNCISAVLDIKDMEQDPQIQYRKMIVQSKDGRLKTVGIPLKFSDTRPEISWDPPALGEDSAAILKELDFTDEAIERLKKQGTIV